MDGWALLSDGRTKKSVAFISHFQAELYGGYVVAARVLGVDLIQAPFDIEEFWSDLGDKFPEVGHA